MNTLMEFFDTIDKALDELLWDKVLLHIVH